MSTNLDSDLLRTFLAVSDAGSLLAGAEKIFRSQSATSIQIQKLEKIIGKPLFHRHGRGVSLTPTGETLVTTARQVIAQLDNAMLDLTEGHLKGQLRIGIPTEHSQGALSQIIAEFSRLHPEVELMVQCSNSAKFPDYLAEGKLDIAVYEVEEVKSGMEFLCQEDMAWVTSKKHQTHVAETLPIALIDKSCWWHDIAIGSLSKIKKPYEIVFKSETAEGIAAAIQAGIAIGVLNKSAISGDLVAIPLEEGFPKLTSTSLVIDFGNDERTPPIDAMVEVIMKTLKE